MTVQYRQKNLTSEQKAQITTDYNAGMPVSEICERYKISHMTVYRALKTIIQGEEEDNGKEKGKE